MLQNRLKLQPLRINFNHAREDFSVHFPKASNTKRENNHFNLFPNNTRNRTNEILIENPRLRLRRTKNYCHPKMSPSVNVTAWLTWKRSWRRAQRCSFKKTWKAKLRHQSSLGKSRYCFDRVFYYAGMMEMNLSIVSVKLFKVLKINSLTSSLSTYGKIWHFIYTEGKFRLVFWDL